MNDRDIDGEKAAKARTQGNHEKCCVKAKQAVDLAEQHKPATEYAYTQTDHPLWAEAVDEPAHEWPKRCGFHRLKGCSARERGLTPAELAR